MNTKFYEFRLKIGLINIEEYTFASLQYRHKKYFTQENFFFDKKKYFPPRSNISAEKEKTV